MQDNTNSSSMDSQTQEWLDDLDDIGELRGYFEPLGQNHFAVLTDASPTLLVTFETIDSIRGETDDELPLGFNLVSKNGWSQLAIIANGNTWFRDRSLYSYFDRLVDDGFFEEFDQVIFMGAGMCGYAAAAFSVVAPGCTVMVYNPIATLDPRVTEWDDRFGSMRRTSFTDRYGYAPDMVEAADQVFVFYDPEEELDAMHAALFTRPHVTKIRTRHLGRHILQDMIHMDILQPLLETAGDGQDIAAHFHSLFRARHEYSPYLRHLLMRLEDDDRSMLSGLLCRNVVNRMKAPRFRRRLIEIEKQLSDSGRSLPKLRDKEAAE